MLVVFNPAAGRRRAALLWRTLDVLVANGVRLELAETSRAGHARELARNAAASGGAPLVVAAGGDGTIAEVASGLLGSRARLGVIPLGTANVLARELALPFAPRAVAAALAFGRTTTLWPGVAVNGASSRVFVQMFGVGFDAHVVRHVSIPLKRAIGRGAYVLQATRELVRYRFQPMRVRIDGQERDVGSMIVSKGRLYGGSYLLAPDAVPGAPGFSVITFDRAGPFSAMAYGAALPFDLLAGAPGVRHARASRIELVGPSPVAAQADGDCAGHGPVVIADAPGPIEVVVG